MAGLSINGDNLHHLREKNQFYSSIVFTPGSSLPSINSPLPHDCIVWFAKSSNYKNIIFVGMSRNYKFHNLEGTYLILKRIHTHLLRFVHTDLLRFINFAFEGNIKYFVIRYLCRNFFTFSFSVSLEVLQS